MCCNDCVWRDYVFLSWWWGCGFSLKCAGGFIILFSYKFPICPWTIFSTYYWLKGILVIKPLTLTLNISHHPSFFSFSHTSTSSMRNPSLLLLHQNFHKNLPFLLVSDESPTSSDPPPRQKVTNFKVSQKSPNAPLFSHFGEP